jgi:hypothetical protein
MDGVSVLVHPTAFRFCFVPLTTQFTLDGLYERIDLFAALPYVLPVLRVST